MSGAKINISVLKSLGLLPASANDAPDTYAGGQLAYHAGLTWHDLVCAGKDKAAQGFHATANGYPRNWGYWKREKKERLLALYNEGKSLTAIARAFKISLSGVTAHLRRMGIVVPRKCRLWTERDDDLLTEMVLEGSNIEECAKLMQRTSVAVATRMVKIGLKEQAYPWLITRYGKAKRSRVSSRLVPGY